ncbi:MAG: small basic protein [Planctomycetes bacterium]|nr:small basic protein [Planctomycetota bacterium]MBL7107130.1 small basic protein [Phycisphaerae bacterium]
MSIDSSLKVKSALERHRNVLSRAERIELLKEEERWSEGETVMGLPKVSHRKVHTSKKSSEKETETETVTEEAAKE